MKSNKILFIILCFFGNYSLAAYYDTKYEGPNKQSLSKLPQINYYDEKFNHISKLDQPGPSSENYLKPMNINTDKSDSLHNFDSIKKPLNKDLSKDVFSNSSYLDEDYLDIVQNASLISIERMSFIKNTNFFIKPKDKKEFNKDSVSVLMDTNYFKKSNKENYYLLMSPYVINNKIDKTIQPDDYLLNPHTNNKYHNKISSNETVESIFLDDKLKNVNKHASEHLSSKLSDRKNLTQNASSNIEQPVKIEQQAKKNIVLPNVSTKQSQQSQPIQPVQKSQPIQPIQQPVKLNSNQPQDLLKNPKFTDESELKEYQRNQALLEISNEQHAQFAQLITEANPKVVAVNGPQYSPPIIVNKDQYDIDVSEIKNLENPMKRELDIEAAKEIMQKPIMIQAIINDKGMICYIDNEEFREGDHIGNETIKKISKDGIVVTNEQGLERKIDF